MFSLLWVVLRQSFLSMRQAGGFEYHRAGFQGVPESGQSSFGLWGAERLSVGLGPVVYFGRV